MQQYDGTAFVTSSFSRDDCVAVARSTRVGVADTKADCSVVLTASPAAWTAFLEEVRGDRQA